MKKVISVVLVLLMLGTLLSGCGKNQAENSSEKEKGTNGTKVDGETIDVEIWVYFEDKECDYFTDIMNTWGEENGYKFKIVSYPFADLNKQYAMGMVSGELPDIAMINNCDTASYVEMGMLQDITEKVGEWGQKENFYDTSLNTTTIDGKLYGLPYNSNCLVLYYDEDLLKEANVSVPKSWDELADVAQQLTKQNQYGFALALPNNDEGTFQYFPFLYSSGADMYNMGSKDAISSLQFLKDMMDAGAISTEVINWSQADVCQQFMQGNAAMMINGPWQIPLLEESVPDKNWKCAPIPADKEQASALGGEGFSIVKDGDIEKLWPVMEFMMDKDTLADWTHEVGKLPPRKDAIDKYSDWLDDEIMQVFFDQLNYAAVLGPSVNWSEISTAIYTALQETMTGQKTAEDACKDAQIKIEGLMK